MCDRVSLQVVVVVMCEEAMRGNKEQKRQQFCRCARELGEEDPRCRYQYFRAECNCFGGNISVVCKNPHKVFLLQKLERVSRLLRF